MGTPADCLASVEQLREAMNLRFGLSAGGENETEIATVALIGQLRTAAGTLNHDALYKPVFLECARIVTLTGVASPPAYDITSGTQSTLASQMASAISFLASGLGSGGTDAVAAAQASLNDLNSTYAAVTPGTAASSSAIDALLAQAENLLLLMGE